MTEESRPGPLERAGLVRLYFALTPVFAIADFAFGLSIRAAGIGNPVWRVAYYVFAAGCWVLLRRRPRWTPWIGMGESSVNIFLLIYAVMGPIFALPVAIAAGESVGLQFGLPQIANLLLSGTVIILSFHRHQSALANLAGPSSRR